MDAAPVSSAKPAVLKGLLTKVRAYFSYRPPYTDSWPQEPKNLSAITSRQHAVHLLKLASEKLGPNHVGAASGKKLPVDDYRELASELADSAFFLGQTEPRDNAIMACRLLGKSARLYLKAGESERARLNYKVASDLAALWRLFPLARLYEKLRGEISPSKTVQSP